jgi:hypothetical protein
LRDHADGVPDDDPEREAYPDDIEACPNAFAVVETLSKRK